MVFGKDLGRALQTQPNPFMLAIQGAQGRRGKEADLARQFALSQGFDPTQAVTRAPGLGGIFGGTVTDKAVGEAAGRRRDRGEEGEKTKLAMDKIALAMKGLDKDERQALVDALKLPPGEEQNRKLDNIIRQGRLKSGTAPTTEEKAEQKVDRSRLASAEDRRVTKEKREALRSGQETEAFEAAKATRAKASEPEAVFLETTEAILQKPVLSDKDKRNLSKQTGRWMEDDPNISVADVLDNRPDIDVDALKAAMQAATTRQNRVDILKEYGLPFSGEGGDEFLAWGRRQKQLAVAAPVKRPKVREKGRTIEGPVDFAFGEGNILGRDQAGTGVPFGVDPNS